MQMVFSEQDGGVVVGSQFRDCTPRVPAYFLGGTTPHNPVHFDMHESLQDSHAWLQGPPLVMPKYEQAAAQAAAQAAMVPPPPPNPPSPPPLMGGPAAILGCTEGPADELPAAGADK